MSAHLLFPTWARVSGIGWTNQVTFTVITIGIVFGLFGMSYVQLMPAFAKQVLGASAGQVGLLMSGAGVGALAGTIFLASLGNFRHKNWLLIASMFLFGVSLFLLAWSPLVLGLMGNTVVPRTERHLPDGDNCTATLRFAGTAG